jgi:hypothetical protein
MAEMSLFRLYLLRAAYLMMAVFLLTSIGPGLLFHTADWPHMSGVARALLAALGLVAALGVRYPVQMLPVLLFETAWKTIWLLAIALPLWRAGRLDGDNFETFKDCAFGVVLMAVVIPWPYAWAKYVRQSGERWTTRRSADGSSGEAMG